MRYVNPRCLRRKMVLEITLITLFVCIACVGKTRYVLYLLVLILPFHSLLKELLSFTNGGGNLFSYWKEICVLIFAAKVFVKNKVNKYVYRTIIPFAILTSLFFILGIFTSPRYSFVHFRDYLFPYIILLSVSSYPLTGAVKRNLFLCFSFSAVLVSFIGYIEYFYEPLRTLFAVIRNLKSESDGSKVFYDTSWMILGYQRMVSVFDNPNQLGAFLSLYLGYGILSKQYSSYFGGIKKIIVFSFVGIAFILTYSRTSYVLFLFPIILMSLKLKKITSKSFYINLSLSVIALVVLMLSSSTTLDVVNSTLNGKEASSAERGNILSNGLDYVISNPFGYGLGSSDLRADDYVFFSESANLNLCVEEGILGLIILFLLYVRLYKKLTTIYKYGFSRYLVPTIFFAAFFSVTPYLYFYLYIAMIFIGGDIMTYDKNKYYLK